MRVFLLTLTVLTLGICLGPLQAAAARTESIAMVVNEQAITMSDVQDRMALIIASSGLPNTPDVQQKLLPQILGSLVDERVRMQEADKLNLSVSPAEVDEGFATIAQQNNMEPEQFRQMIVRGGLNIKTMEDQIRAQIAWGKVVQAKLRPQVVVSEGDIDNYLERLAGNTGQPEYLVSEIYLPVENPKQQAQTQQFAQKLVQEIRSGEAPFEKLAQQFSKSAGAPQGGNIGWIARGQLSQELDEKLPLLEKGAVSAPIHTPTGFYILMLRDQRVVTADNLPSRDEVMSTIGLQRLDRLQRRYLMDLKAAAFIENRIGG